MKTIAVTNAKGGTGRTTTPAASGELTLGQYDRVAELVAQGRTVLEAMAQVRAEVASTPSPVPDAKAGDGTGNKPLTKRDMNQILREAVGR